MEIPVELNIEITFCNLSLYKYYSILFLQNRIDN